MKRSASPQALVLFAAVSLSGLVPLLIWLGYLRLEVPGQHWFCHNPQSPRAFLLLPALALVALLVVLGRALAGRTRERAGMVLLVAVVASYLLAIGVRGSSKMGFTTLAMTIVFEGSNSYYLAALQTPDPLALARDYPRQMPHLPLHATTQSPGAMLLHAGLHRLFTRSPGALAFAEALLWLHPCHRPGEVADEARRLMGLAVQPQDISGGLLIALLFPAVMALGVLPLYGLARRLAGSRTALVLVTLYAVTPSFLWFTASVDQVYIAVALLVAWLGLRGVRERKPWLLVLAGGLTGTTIFLNLGFTLMAGIATVFVFLLAWRRQRQNLGGAVLRGALVLGTALVVLTVICLLFGVNLLAVMAVVARLRNELYQGLHRGYLTWLLLNPMEFSLGMGFSGVALVGAGVVLWRRLTYPAGALLASVLLALAGLAALGQVRGETSRMLMFVMPLLLAAVAPAVRRLRLQHLGPALVLILAQATYAVAGYQLFDVWGDWTLPFR